MLVALCPWIVDIPEHQLWQIYLLTAIQAAAMAFDLPAVPVPGAEPCSTRRSAKRLLDAVHFL